MYTYIKANATAQYYKYIVHSKTLSLSAAALMTNIYPETKLRLQWLM